ncbi:MAG: hypothetical protein F6K47_05265 [Symploca sp. SIO2E6]|nr:hypothetical protein [Symploca sp. SIO2E6]
MVKDIQFAHPTRESDRSPVGWVEQSETQHRVYRCTTAPREKAIAYGTSVADRTTK